MRFCLDAILTWQNRQNAGFNGISNDIFIAPSITAAVFMLWYWWYGFGGALLVSLLLLMI